MASKKKKSISELLDEIEAAPSSAKAQVARDTIAARTLRVTFWNNVAIFSLTALIVLVTFFEAWMHILDFKADHGRLPWESQKGGPSNGGPG